jgi:hypothetical protein
MSKRIRVTLPQGWSDYSHENPDGPPTYLRDDSDVPGPLQISAQWYAGGEVPDPSLDDLIKLAKAVGNSWDGQEVIETGGGQCAFGRFGTVVSRTTELARAQVWYLSNGRDFILATHFCSEQPDPLEIDEAREIVHRLGVVEKPWWRFW